MDDMDAELTDDPNRWLEDVTGEDALAWVRERNAETARRFAQTSRYTALRDEIREVLDADDRIPYVTRRGAHLYNFWRDAAHPRGHWRRTTLDEYRRPNPNWEVLLDIDELAAAEGENWVWEGARVLRPEYRRALVELSRGGADATVVAAHAFVAGKAEQGQARFAVFAQRANALVPARAVRLGVDAAGPAGHGKAVSVHG